jgi:hypothetical protein
VEGPPPPTSDRFWHLRHGGGDQHLTEAASRAVLRHRARRVRTFVPHGISLGKVTGLRLEAMSGGVIDASPAPLRTRMSMRS